ncbi:MFS transporter [Spirillospora sp. NBC_00431]
MPTPVAASLSVRRRRAALVVLCLVVVLGIAENTILNVALPSIRTDLGASTQQLQWITDAYVLVFAGFVLVAANLADRFGRKGMLLCGLAVVGVFSIVAAFAVSPGQLIALRALLGLGAAFIFPVSLSILVNVFTDPVERGRAIATWGATVGVSAAAGPIIGGLLLRAFSWSAIFWVNVVVVGLLLLGATVLPTSRDPQPRPLDIPGAVLSVALLSLLTWSIIQGQHDWTEPSVLMGFAGAAILLAAFVGVERRQATPMLELDVFRNPRFTVPAVAVTVAFLVLNGTLFVVTMYLQSVLRFSPLQAGLCMVPGGVAMVMVARFSAHATERFGPRVVITAGFLVSALGLLLLAGLHPESAVAAVVAAITVFYAGIQFISGPAATTIMNSVPKERAGTGSSINNLTRQLGTALGIAVFGSVLSGTYATRVRDVAESAGLSAPETAKAEHNVGAAMDLAQRTGNATLRTGVQESFTAGMAHAMVIGLAVFVAAAIATAIALRRREDHQ